MHDPLQYEGTHAVVTGCASGMGAATAAILTDLGATVTGLDVQDPESKGTAEGVARFLQVDLKDKASIDAAVAAIEGPVDSVFSVAGLPGPPFSDLDTVMVNFVGPRHLIESLVPTMPSGAAAVCVASNAGLGWQQDLEWLLPVVSGGGFDEGRAWCEANADLIATGYVPSKKLLNAWVAWRAASLLDAGIRLNCQNPGPTETAMMPQFEAFAGKEMIDAFVGPSKRRSTAEEQAWPLVFLNSRRSSYIAGEALHTDAGFLGAATTGQIQSLLQRGMADFSHIAYSVDDGIATITLHRPDRLNAFTKLMQVELCRALDEIDADGAVRAVVVTGEGRGFSAGADLGSGEVTFDTDNVPAEAGIVREADGRHRDEGGLVSLRIFRLTKPIIAAVNGPAVGVGATMTLPMDVRLASTAARFGFVFARRGIVPEACSSWFLPRVVGISRAMEWCATGRVFDAEEALAGGLVRSIHPPDELLPVAYGLAREIADNASGLSVALTRAMLWRLLGAPHPMEAHRLDSAFVDALGATGEAREGVMSFLEKRPPSFPGRVPDDLPDPYPWWDEPAF